MTSHSRSSGPTSAPAGDSGRPLARTPQRSGPHQDQLTPHAGRFLDPGAATRFPGQQLSSTVYAGDALLLRPRSNEEEIFAALAKAAKAEACTARRDPVDQRLVDLARKHKIDLDAGCPLIVRVRLTRSGTRPLDPPDAWRVLQRFRAGYKEQDQRRQAVQLEHLLTTGAGIAPAPYIALDVTPNPYIALGVQPKPYIALPYIALPYATNPYIALPYARNPTAEYAQPGSGGRTPVAWVGARPVRRTDDDLPHGKRRPVVAVLDTGAGQHPWLDDDVVDRHPTCAGIPIGDTDPATDLERTGVVTGGLTGSLDIEAGHGTFIAGLVHQRCPDARILAIRVVQPDGIIREYDLLQALSMLWLRQRIALRSKDAKSLIDVVSLSLGYYHEEPSDATFDPLMLAPLRALGRLGVAVVVSAGNDATSRPMFPAAFSPHPGGVVPEPSAGELPVVAVGALNPDRTIALFSNDGAWVRAYRPGAALVSTIPTTFDGGQSASVKVATTDGQHETIDPDDFRSGFATWSGSSFASPILAGDVAAYLNEQGWLAVDEFDVRRSVEHGWRALKKTVPCLPVPGGVGS